MGALWIFRRYYTLAKLPSRGVLIYSFLEKCWFVLCLRLGNLFWILYVEALVTNQSIGICISEWNSSQKERKRNWIVLYDSAIHICISIKKMQKFYYQTFDVIHLAKDRIHFKNIDFLYYTYIIYIKLYALTFGFQSG